MRWQTGGSWHLLARLMVARSSALSAAVDLEEIPECIFRETWSVGECGGVPHLQGLEALPVEAAAQGRPLRSCTGLSRDLRRDRRKRWRLCVLNVIELLVYYDEALV